MKDIKKGGGIFQSIGTFIGDVVESVATSVIDFLVESATAIIEAFSDSSTERISKKGAEAPTPNVLKEKRKGAVKIIKGQYQTYYEELNTWYKNTSGFWNTIMYFGLWGFYNIAEFVAKVKMMMYEAQKEAVYDITPERPDLNAVLTHKFRNTNKESRNNYYGLLEDNVIPDDIPDQQENINDYRKLLGFDTQEWDFIREGSRPNLQVSELLEEARRNRIPEADVVPMVESLGYSREKATRIAALMWRYPGPQDLIRFQVRESYYPEYMAKWGSLREMSEKDKIPNTKPGEEIFIGNPPEEPNAENSPFVRDAEKVGVNKYWAKKYWASHWDLPSPRQGYEMLHRGVISEEELKDLFKALDIMPGWRQAMIDISWRLPTRVDIRRMWDRGVFTSQEELYTVYTELGYHKDYRDAMVAFTLAFYQDKPRKMARTLILKAWSEDIPEYNTIYAVTRKLEQIGYTQDDALTIANMHQQEMLEEARKEDEEVLQSKFVMGKLAWGVIAKQLNATGYTSDQIQILEYKWKKKKQREEKQISERIMLELHAGGKLDDGKLVEDLLSRGYSQNEADQLETYAETILRDKMQ